MHRLLIDTCVWLDLAKDYRNQPVIAALEDFLDHEDFGLIVPQVGRVRPEQRPRGRRREA